MAKASFSIPDYVVFSIMMAVSAGIGIWYGCGPGGRQKTTEEYLLADRQMRVWPVAVSLSVSFFSAITLLGVPSEIYTYGVQYSVIIFSSFIIFPVVNIIFLPMFHRVKVTCANELAVKPWRRPLTMGNQCSEMKAKYTGSPGVNLDTVYHARVQPFNLSDHHLEGNSKRLVPSTINRYSAGQEYYPRDKGVLTYHGDPYLTTTNKDHRAFTGLELSRYPKKQYATYWECEGYPKAWGHGSKHNPLPPDSVPREKGPMRDVTWFKTATTIPRLPLSMNPVPNKGMISLVKESYTDPPERKCWELFTCDVPKPWHSPLETPGKGEMYQVPRMHHIEYENYGSGKTVTV